VPTCSSCATDNPEHARFCLACGRPLAGFEPTETRRQVTILFADLAGSTELAHRLDAEGLHRVLEEYYDAARSAVARHGGNLEKFIGDAVMAVFGFPRANEDDALRAVRTAWEFRAATQERNEELRRRWGVELTARIGVATGNVMASDRATGEPFVMGTPVNLAARLEQAAGHGQILLDGVTRGMARAAIVTEPVELDDLRGFDGTVTAHRLLELTDADGGVSRPEPPFVNRVVELRLLDEAFESHRTSARCRTVTLVGSAGLGKSRLVAEFLRRHPNAQVLGSRCPSSGEASALQPLRDVVGQAAGFAARTPPDDALATIRVMLAEHPQGAEVATGVARAIGLEPGTTTQEETVWSIRVCLETIARRRPLILVFDDVQWASPALLAVLEHVAEWARDAPILLLCLARPELLNVLPTWGRTPGAVTMQLEPLATEPSRELARHLLLSTVDPSVEDTIADVADGNPFFLEEIVTMLQEEGAIRPEADAGALADIAIPPTISALLAARIDRLEPEARRVLEHAAVLGLAFSSGHVAGLLPDDAGIDVDTVLRDLTQRDFVVEDPEAPGAGSFRFRHALTREAAYESIPKSIRVRLHSAAAERIGHEPPGETRDERIGFHLEQAHRAARDLGDLDHDTEGLGERGGVHLAAAGRAAAGRGDVRAAAGLFERATALLPATNAERREVLADLHDALFFAGEIERSEAPVAELLASLEPDDESPTAERARLQQAMLRFLLSPGAIPIDTLRKQVERSIGQLEEAGHEGNLAQALADLATIHWVEGNAAAMLEAAERALGHALACGSRRATAEAAPLIAYALHQGEVPLDEGLERIEGTRQRLRDDRLARALIRLDEARMLAAVGRSEDAHAATDRARTIFADLGQRRWLEMARATEAEIVRREGRLDRAEGLLRTVGGFFRDQGDANNALTIEAVLADLLCDMGRHVEADRLASDVARDAPSDDLEVQVEWRTARARTQAAAGDPGMAVWLAEEAVSIANSTDFVLLQADAYRALGETLVAAGRGDDATAALASAVARYDAKRASASAAATRDRAERISPR
jgi:class 3 adenylate cyclase/predicted ATPase